MIKPASPQSAVFVGEFVSRTSRLRGIGGFSLMEIMVVLVLLFAFGAASITTLMVSNQSAMTSRNQTLARAAVVERINTIIASGTVEDVDGENVVLWQIDDAGDSVKIEGEIDVTVSADPGGNNTQKVNVTLTYPFAGRTIVYSMNTIVVK